MSVISIIEVVPSSESFSQFVEFKVELDSASIVPVVVNFRTLYDGTATNLDIDNSFTSSLNNGTLTFAPGETLASIFVEADSDTLDESDEHVVLELFDPTNGSFTGDQPVLRATGIILDNDGPGSNLALFVGDPVIIEGDAGTKTARFEIVLSQPAPSNISFSYATRDGSAIAGQDYTASSGTVSFDQGQFTKTVDVPVIGDTVGEAAEWFALKLTNQSAVTVDMADSVGVAEIRDTDASALPEISIEGSATIESFSNFIRFKVSLSEPFLDAVTVNYRTLYDGTATNFDVDNRLESSANRGTITFAPGETEKSILVEADSDTIDEADEHLTVELFDPSNATFGDGQPALRATGIILDNDGVGSNLALFVGDPVLIEGDGGTKLAQFDIVLSRPAPTDLFFSFTTRDGSALAGQDYIATSGTLSFVEGQTLGSVQVPVIGDTVGEAAEWFALKLTSLTETPLDMTDSVGVAEILDTDATILPEISIQGDTIIESFSNFMQFTVTLSEPFADAVTVNFRTLFDGTATNFDVDNALESATNNGTLTFAAGETSKSIFVEADSDTLDEADEHITVELFDPTNATFGNGQPALRATGVILDNDGPGSNLALFVGDPVLIEGDSGTKLAQFDIQLSRPAPADLQFDYTTLDGSALAGQDYHATSGTLTFVEGQTLASVQVPVIGDTVAEAQEWFSLRLTTESALPVNLDNSVGMAEIRDTDTSALPEISIQGDATIESFSNFMRFTVSLSEASNEAVTATYNFGLGTASEQDIDFSIPQSGSGTVTFSPGETTKSLFFEADSDTLIERDESVFLTLTNPENAVFGRGVSSISAGGFIFDNDNVGFQRALYAPPVTFNEATQPDGPSAVLVELSDPSALPLSFTVTPQSGTATEGSDYRLLTDTITFQPFETQAAIYLEILPDARNEQSEFVEFAIQPVAENSFFGDVPNARVTIENVVPIDGSSGNNALNGTVAGDLMLGLGGNDTIEGRRGNDTILGGAGSDTILGGTGEDLLNGGNGRDDIFGGDDDDTILGRKGRDSLRGEGGEDTLEGGDGDDTLFGDEGDDTLLGEDGNDVIDGGNGRDEAFGGEDDDAISGGRGKDTLRGEQGNDTLVGGDADDTLIGGAGNDTLRGDDGEDQLEGGNGRDAAFGGDDDDVLFGGKGKDTLHGDKDDDVLNGGDGDDTLSGDAGKDTLRGDGGNDQLDGGGGGDSLLGGDNNDVLLGGDGRDTLRGEQGNDTLEGGDSDDRIFGGNGLDILRGGEGADFLRGEGWRDELWGGSANDTLRGGDGDDTLRGEDGDDILEGGDGDDTIIDDAGADIYIFRAGAGNDVITGFGADDVIRILAGASEATSFAAFFAATTQDGDNTVYDFGNDEQNTITLVGVDRGTLTSSQFDSD
ncbi:MAG: Calx-beta domain-containing protein [Pseudomonadota bacterium]